MRSSSLDRASGSFGWHALKMLEPSVGEAGGDHCCPRVVLPLVDRAPLDRGFEDSFGACMGDYWVQHRTDWRRRELARRGIERRGCRRLDVRPLAKPPALIPREAERAARSRACLFVGVGTSFNKRALAYKAPMRMTSVVLMWGPAKPPMRPHPISS